MILPDIAPMLAERGLPAGELHSWAVEPKLDGWRVTVLVDDAYPGGVRVRTRRGRTITDAIPGIADLAGSGRRLLLDGELVAYGGRASDFYALGSRLGRVVPSRAVPVSFWAFDLLWLDGEVLIERSYLERRILLEELILSGSCGVVRRFSGVDTSDLLGACAAHDLEGVVLKRLNSRYRPGRRSRDWRKVKAPGWAPVHAQRRRLP